MHHEREHHIIDFIDQMPEPARQTFAETVYQQLDTMTATYKDHTQKLAQSQSDHIYVQLSDENPNGERSWLKITEGTLQKEKEMMVGRLKYLVYLDRQDLLQALVERHRFNDSDSHEPSTG